MWWFSAGYAAFSPQVYPCFKDEFLHPIAMIELMAETAAPVFGRGYIASSPALMMAHAIRCQTKPDDRRREN